MIRTRVYVLVFGCLALLFAATITPSPVCAQVELTYSTLFPVTHRHTQLAVEWGKEIEKRNQGRCESHNVCRSHS